MTERTHLDGRTRWFQFTLRGLLFFVTLVSLVFGWLGVHLRRVSERQRQACVIQKLGGGVTYPCQVRDVDEWGCGSHERLETCRTSQFLDEAWFAPIVRVTLDGRQVTDESLGELGLDPSLEELFLEDTSVTDDGARQIGKITQLRVLSFCGESITGACLADLSELPSLEALCLMATDVDDEGIRHLTKRKSLRHLTLTATNVTDEGMVHLAKMTNLESLYLEDTRVTDEGLRHLGVLTRLKRLDLADTAVTDRGLRCLKGLVNLEFLVLDGTRITDEGLETIGRFRQLRELRIHGTNLNGSGLVHLLPLSRLRVFGVDTTPILETDKGVEYLTELSRRVKCIAPRTIRWWEGDDRLTARKREKDSQRLVATRNKR